MSDTPRTDALREVIIGQYKENELTGTGMGNILAALADIETLERERDEARGYADKLAAGLPEGMLPKDVDVLRDANLALAMERDSLQEQLDAAIMLGKMQERRHERELEQVREQYRLSSVCRELKAAKRKTKTTTTMSTQCKYQPIRSIGEIPDGIVLNCKWVENGCSTYDKAYKLNGFWYLVWNDEVVNYPNAIQCRRTAINNTSPQAVKDLLLAAVDNELRLRQEIRDQLEHIQTLEEEIQRLTK